jgi:nitroreductase
MDANRSIVAAGHASFGASCETFRYPFLAANYPVLISIKARAPQPSEVSHWASWKMWGPRWLNDTGRTVLGRPTDPQLANAKMTIITRREANEAILAGAVAVAAPAVARAEAGAIELPPPRAAGGKPLTEALKLRRSIREYSDRPLPPQVLSDLLWSAFGINRSTGDRTAPYWRHIMVIDIYAALMDGVWQYEPKNHTLLPHLKADIRAQTGMQDFVGGAPLNLIYVAHGERMKDIAPAERRLYASVDTGFIGQNVYLFCASEGLATVFRGAVPYQELERTLRLGQDQFVTFAQTVGFPKG